MKPKRTVIGRTLILIAIAIWFLVATVPYLSDYPPLEWAQMGIAAPAYKLASEGVYGNDLFTGFHRAEVRNYEYMPLYPLLVAASFKILGLGVWQARLVSVVAGLLTVLLTYHLGRRFFDQAVGLCAAAVMCVVRFGGESGTSGITMVDYSRWIRYDVLVPVFVLAASAVFLKTLQEARQVSLSFLGAGLLAGLAALAHVYGLFVLAVFITTLVWRDGAGLFRRPALYLLVGGTALALLPWMLYVLQDLEAYRGQMSRHEGRFALLNPAFYVGNLLREYHRYGAWAEGFPEGLLAPRLGIWLLLLGIPTALGLLWRRARAPGKDPERFLLLSVPTLALLLGLLVSLKRHVYVLLLLPFLALQLSVLAAEAWRWAGARRWHLRLGLLLVGLLAAAEGVTGVARTLQRASRVTPYRAVTTAIAEAIPRDARILISQPYWLGLAEYESRSLNLFFVLSGSVEEIMGKIGAGYVVIERSFVDPRARPASAQLAVTERWLEIGRYLEAHCGVVRTVADDTYGTIYVYRCPSAREPVRMGATHAEFERAVVVAEDMWSRGPCLSDHW